MVSELTTLYCQPDMTSLWPHGCIPFALGLIWKVNYSDLTIGAKVLRCHVTMSYLFSSEVVTNVVWYTVILAWTSPYSITYSYSWRFVYPSSISSTIHVIQNNNKLIVHAFQFIKLSRPNHYLHRRHAQLLETAAHYCSDRFRIEQLVSRHLFWFSRIILTKNHLVISLYSSMHASIF